ncbi:hypothetical protein F5J12DRAFT_900761 [Pisolithus orientalis]|uniref:uncharacterized protein n=1 Tax=Pisolithus orientalis TaxID=936130 RepID=UPI002224EF90|nr:uncharacterized protein F5J12DRAFT_900761 [Pisolithus orientalis]KAI5981557.1 hypothetical protein F5J12DRAFT_900761 [Pisolithus orientalis]
MPYKKPLEMMNAFQQTIAQHKALNSSMCQSQENDMDVMSLAIMSSKCLCEESTDLPNNSIVNPLAPPPTQQKKGGGHSAGQNAKLKSNVAPPPYVPPIVNGPSPADMPPNPIPQSSTAVATPVFHQHPTDSHHFGFSVPAQQPGHIMPPRMEPDLQVLNNPYIAAIQGDQVPSNTSHPPTPQPNYQSWFIPHQPPATSLEKLSSEGSSEEELEDDAALHPIPDHDLLTLAHDSVNEVSQCARAPHNSKKAKDEGPLPSQLRFYKAVWKDCLEDAKQECRAAHALSNPFPSKSHDLNLSITEVLVTVIVEWNQHGVQFEDELKLVMLATTPSTFNLIPPSDVAPQVCVQWIETAATKLLDNSLFLQDGFNENEAVIQFYYTGTYRIMDKHPESFNNSVPLSCLALVAAMYHCVLDRFVKNSTGKTMPQFSSKAYNSIFHGMMKVLNDILHNPYHSMRLHNQLSQWAKEGWAALQEVDSNVERYQHIQAVLD